MGGRPLFDGVQHLVDLVDGLLWGHVPTPGATDRRQHVLRLLLQAELEQAGPGEPP
jgi:hypothetical protein